MARIIYGALAESIRGSIGGTTFQKNAYGFTIKKKPNMIHPNSPWQQIQKIIFSKAVHAWNALTVAQRTDWDTWASTYPQYAKNNPSSQLSGFNVFVRQHSLLFLSDEPVDTNPTYVQYDAASGTLALATNGALLRITQTDSQESEEFWVAIFLSHPISGSTNFIGTKTRYFLTRTNAADVWTTSTNLWLQKFGILPAVGQKVAYRMVFFGVDNGQVLADQKAIITVGSYV